MLYPSSSAEFLKTFQLISTACCCCQDFCKLGQKLNFEKKHYILLVTEALKKCEQWLV